MAGEEEEGKVSAGVGQEGWGHLLCLREETGRDGLCAGSQRTCHVWMEEEGGSSTFSISSSHPPRVATSLKAHGHLALSY